MDKVSHSSDAKNGVPTSRSRVVGTVRRPSGVQLVVKVVFIILILLAACQPAPRASVAPSAVPISTVTPGNALRGVLATQPRPLDGVANPATALFNQPTATPDLRNCPASSNISLSQTMPDNAAQISSQIINVLSAGGSPLRIADTLRDDWEILGSARTDLDLTGEGIPEVILTYSVPDGGGVLLIAGCLEGRYTLRYQAISDEPEPPELLIVGDMNANQITDLLFLTRACDAALGECGDQTNLITWEPGIGRFVSLLGSPIVSQNPPEVIDFDNDQVNELLIRLTDDGDVDTGPLRTGTIIYDWNGTLYVSSIIRLDPPEYRIQLIHQADRYFQEDNIDQAVSLYQEALADEELEDWYSDEAPILESYVLYRLFTVQAVVDPAPEAIDQTFTQINDGISAEAASAIYMEMARLFHEVIMAEGSPADACDAVAALVEAQPQALDLLNRYGNRSPIYTMQDVCPF